VLFRSGAAVGRENCAAAYRRAVGDAWSLATDFFHIDTIMLQRLYVLVVVRREALVDRVEVIDLRLRPVVAGW